MNRIAHCCCGAPRAEAIRRFWARVIAWSANGVPAPPLASAPISRKNRCAPRGRARSTCAAATRGRKIEFHFCPDCGSTVFWYGELFPDLIGIAFGAFADPSMPWPPVSVWETTRHPWVTFGHKLAFWRPIGSQGSATTAARSIRPIRISGADPLSNPAADPPGR